MFNKLNPFRRPTVSEQVCDAGKTAAKVVGTCVLGTIYGIGAVAIAMGEAAAESERRRAEARKEAAEARKVADEAERKAREAERKAYGTTAYCAASSNSDVVRTRTTSCNGVVYEIERRYNGMCKYTVTVRRYYSGKVVRIEDTYAYTNTTEVERRFRDEIQRGYMD